MADHSQIDAVTAAHPVGGHQPDQVRISTILWFGVALVVTCILIFTTLWFVMLRLGRIDRALEVRSALFDDQEGQYPPPRLQQSPASDMDTYRRQMDEAANSYGWVDRKKEIARVPIERAMELALEKGALKSRAEAPTDQGTPQVRDEAETAPIGAAQPTETETNPPAPVEPRPEPQPGPESPSAELKEADPAPAGGEEPN